MKSRRHSESTHEEYLGQGIQETGRIPRSTDLFDWGKGLPWTPDPLSPIRGRIIQRACWKNPFWIMWSSRVLPVRWHPPILEACRRRDSKTSTDAWHPTIQFQLRPLTPQSCRRYLLPHEWKKKKSPILLPTALYLSFPAVRWGCFLISPLTAEKHLSRFHPPHIPRTPLSHSICRFSITLHVWFDLP